MQKKGYWSFDEKKQARKMRLWRRKSEREREQKTEKKKKQMYLHLELGE